MPDDIITAKLKRPSGLAWFATDAGLRYLAGCALAYAPPN